MADVARLKQELKAWERNFRDEHGGRAPTKEDTKKDPAIGAHIPRDIASFMYLEMSYRLVYNPLQLLNISFIARCLNLRPQPRIPLILSITPVTQARQNLQVHGWYPFAYPITCRRTPHYSICKSRSQSSPPPS